MTQLVARRNGTAAAVAAAVVPAAGCAVLIPFRENLANTNAALLLVLLVVGAAATGVRTAGVVAAASSAAWFDFFLTRPYERFAITSEADVVTAVLLVLVGLAVTEIALWGRRQQALASRDDGYLNGVIRTAGLVAGGPPRAETLIESVADQVVEILQIDDCWFDSDVRDAAPAALIRDGSVVRRGRVIDVKRHGLPTDSEIELRVQHRGVTRGRFLLVASTHLVCPAPAQLRVVVALADQVGAALATQDDHI